MTRSIYLGLGLLLVVLTIGATLILTHKQAEAPTIFTPTPAEETPITSIATSSSRSIGNSVEGRPIMSYTFGTGSTTVLFVGGIHGGYEWNSTVLAYEFIAELESGIFTIPPEFTLVVIPTLNPDGLYAVVGTTSRFTAADVPTNDAHQTGAGRFNANRVDLNRNFACKWQSTSSWRSKTVSAGTSAFSEPEAEALRKLVAEVSPQAAIFWHSQANTVYASECEAGVLPLTRTLMKTYAAAASYQSVESFTAYPITGDAEGWLASLGIPALTVELKTRTESEWLQNRMGVSALLEAL